MIDDRIVVRAPSNIALVKYMGKRDSEKNLPENASLSLTLSSLCTFVELRRVNSGGIRLVAERPASVGGEAPRISAAGEEKFLRHFARVQARGPDLFARFGFTSREGDAAIEIRSANTFPAAAGIASSASSFAALTLATMGFLVKERDRFQSEYGKNSDLRRALAALSREGSGSSARSFEGPFVAWTDDHSEKVESSLPPLSDLVVVVSGKEKSVGSSEAHRRVKSSPRWAGRIERANGRFEELRKALRLGDFSRVIELARDDSKDMHTLFETSNPPFSYFTDGTHAVLEFLAGESGCAVTMDAGPNVHVIVPQSEAELWRSKLTNRFPEYPLLVDREGTGAEFCR